MSPALEAFRLDGRVAIVTGASRGLGRSMALALAEAGADVAVAARSEGELAETAGAIEKLGRRALAIPTDVTAYAQVAALVERTATTMGRLDIVVNNSGVAAVMPVAEMPPEDFRRSVEVNLVGVFNGCRAAAARLIAQKSGKIVNLASVLGAAGPPGVCRVFRLQGRRHRAHPGPRRGVGPLQYPGERDGAGLVRHRHEP